MSKNALSSENEVKALLGIDDFRSIKKEQIIEFVSSIPDMDKETAMKCIEQFPNFKDSANFIVENFFTLCNEITKEDGKETLSACKETLDDLRFMLKKDSISEDMQHFIIEKIIEISNLMADMDNDKRRFKETVLRIAGTIASIAIATGGAILGVKLSKK